MASLPEETATIQGVDFNARATAVYLGTDTGKVYKYAIAQRELIASQTLSVGEGVSVEILYCLNYLQGKDVFVAYGSGAAPGKELMTLDFDQKKVQHFPIGDNDVYGGEICQIMATPDSEFVLLGVPATSSFCVFGFDKYKSALSLQKRVHIDGFRTFEMDRHATQLVFLNQRCR